MFYFYFFIFFWLTPPFFSAQQNAKNMLERWFLASVRNEAVEALREAFSLWNMFQKKEREREQERSDVWSDVSRGTWKYTNREWNRLKVCGVGGSGGGGGFTPKRSPTAMTDILVASSRVRRVAKLPCAIIQSQIFLVSQWDHLWWNKRREGWRWPCCAGIRSHFQGWSADRIQQEEPFPAWFPSQSRYTYNTWM